MIRLLLGMITAAVVMASSSYVQAKENVKIVIIGDSTVANYKPEHHLRGWGQMIVPFFNDDVKIINRARSGKSTKTFITQHYWKKAKKYFSAGDFVMIQFGHNDSHKKGKPESTDAQTDYKEYLRQYIDEIRSMQATPILVTPMLRGIFRKDGTLSQGLKKYADAMKEIAAEKKVECIDLYLLSEKLLTDLGKDKSIPLLFASQKDVTHFSEKGATVMAELIINSIKENNSILKQFTK